MDVASVKEALNLNSKNTMITPYTLGMVLNRVGATGGGGSSSNVCPYRVGDVLFSTIDDDPALAYPGTTWTREAEGRYVLCAGTSTDGNGESRTLTGGQTGGVWEHTHSIGHTHTMPHTHPIPHTHNYVHTHTMPHTHTITSHTHKLGDSGYACIYYGGSTFYSREINKSGLFTATSYKTVSGTAGDNTKTHAYATTLGGITGDSSSTPASGAASSSTTATQSTSVTGDPNTTNSGAASSSTTASQSTSTSGSTQGVPPYFCLYAWRRTS